MWQNGEILTELGWMILVLTPKGNTNTRGINLLKTLWKLVEATIDTRMRASIRFHKFFHGLCTGRGTGKAILELKLAQELASVDQDPLFLVFLDLLKAYDTVDWVRLLTTLEG